MLIHLWGHLYVESTKIVSINLTPDMPKPFENAETKVQIVVGVAESCTFVSDPLPKARAERDLTSIVRDVKANA